MSAANVWLLKAGEPLPGGSTHDRLFRTGQLADLLARRGHQVTWWSSTVDHVRKIQLADRSVRRVISERYELRLLHGPLYTRNRSPWRFLNHRAIANEFVRLAADAPVPDAIVCSLPTVEFAVAASRYGARHGVPVIIDIRDLWPDIMVHLAPGPFRRPARWALQWMYDDFGEAIRSATAVCGISDEAVDWAMATAGRTRSPLDQVFPHAYMDQPPHPAAVAEAEAQWDKLGVAAEDGKFRACYLGNMSRRHELHVVIEAARQLAGTRPEIQFVLAGQGEQLKSLKQLARGLDNVILPGWIDAAALWTLMRRSQVGLLPYPSAPDWTRWPTNKVGEYFSSRLPIVSSLTGAVAKLLETYGCGVTYPNGDAGALTDTLRTLAADPETVAAMSRRAGAIYEERFKGEVVYSRFADFVEALVRSSNRDAVAPMAVRVGS